MRALAGTQFDLPLRPLPWWARVCCARHGLVPTVDFDSDSQVCCVLFSSFPLTFPFLPTVFILSDSGRSRRMEMAKRKYWPQMSLQLWNIFLFVQTMSYFDGTVRLYLTL